MKGGWKPYDESLVYFDSFVRRGSDRVFVNIFEIRGIEILGKGRGYDFGRKTLHEPQGMILEGQLFLET